MMPLVADGISRFEIQPPVQVVAQALPADEPAVAAASGEAWVTTPSLRPEQPDISGLPFGPERRLFVVIGGIFVMEAISVILQVGSYKLRKKRIFKMAPIHHHFELKGWPEPKVIVRFWIISIVLSILSIATLKLR